MALSEDLGGFHPKSNGLQHSGGLGVEGVFARRCVYVCNCAREGRIAYGEFCNSGHFWRFQTSRSLVSHGRRGTLWHSNMLHDVSKVVLCGRRNTLATFSEDAFQFSWQVQHFGDLHRHFAWQAQHFRRVVLRVFCESRQVVTSCKFRGRHGILWDVLKIDGSLARNIDFEVEVHKKIGRKTSILKLHGARCKKWRKSRTKCSFWCVSSRVSGFLVASPCLWGKLQNLSFSEVSKQVVMSFCVAGRRGISWHSHVSANVSKVVLWSRRNIFASLSEDGSQFLWQAQHFGDLQRAFAWQAQHFRYVVFFANRIVRAAWSGNIPRQAWHVVPCDDTPHSTLHTSLSTLHTPHFTLHTSHSTLHILLLHFALHTPHSTLHILHFTLCTPHFTLYTPHFTLHTLHSTLYTPHSTLYTSHFTLYTPHSTAYTLHFTLHTLHSTLHTPYSTIYTPHSALHTPHYTLHFTLHTLHSTLHTLHFTLYTPDSAVHSRLYTPNSTLYTPHFTLYTLHSTLYTLHSTLHTSHSTLYTPHFTLRTLHSTLHTLHFTLYTPHSTAYTLHFALNTLHFTFHTLHCTPTHYIHFTLHTLHCTLHTLHSRVCSAHSTLSTAHLALYTQYPLHTIHMHSPLNTALSSHPTLCTPHSSVLHSLQCTGTVTGKHVKKCSNNLFQKSVLRDCIRVRGQR